MAEFTIKHNGPNSYGNMYCTNECEYPIEHLFKSIILMQDMAELDKETERLKKRLKTFFMKATKEKDGVRVYGDAITYHPTGLCEWGNWVTILPEWKSNYEPPEPEQKVDIMAEVNPNKKKRRPTKRKYPAEQGLRDHYLIWYAQLREHEGKRYVINENSQYHLEKLIKKKEVYDKLDQAGKDMINKSHNYYNKLRMEIRNVASQLLEHVNEMIPNNEGYMEEADLRIPLLMEDELKDLKTACELAREKYENYKGYWRKAYHVYIKEEVNKFIRELDFTREGRVVLDLNHAFTVKKETRTGRRYKRFDNEKNQNIYEDYTWVHESVEASGVLDALSEQISKIEDENILKVLEKFKLTVPKKEEESESEEQEDQELVTQ